MPHVRYATLGLFMEALKRGDVERERVRVLADPTHGWVVAWLREPDGSDGERLYESRSLGDFLIDFGKAFGLEVHVG